ncbi:MAG: type transport system permease protein [Acidobacteriota bacterium]|nr:type transport system permease protein [Acidobacteriota bacterium]
MSSIDSRQERLPLLTRSTAKLVSVVRAIATRELREHILSARLMMILATTLVLVVLSTLSGISNYRVQAEQYKIAAARAEQKLREATTWSDLQPILVRPLAPLMILNAGFEARDGRVVVASSSQIPANTQDSPVGTPYLARFSGFDTTTVIVYLLGLLAILLSFDAVSGEKEKGTLALSFSNALPRSAFFLGKYLGGMAALALSLGLSLAAVLVVWLVSGVNLPASAWPRVGLWFVALLLHLSAMFLTGLLISVLTRRAAVSLLVGMVTWFVLVIFIPVVAPFAASQLARLPSSYALEKEMARLDGELERKSEEVKKAMGTPPESEGVSISLEQGVSMNFYTPEAYEWWLSYYSKRAELEREYAVAVYEKIEERQVKNREQAELAFKLSSLSPVAHLERVVNELTGTSRDDFNHFLAAAQSYRQDLIDFYDANHLTTSLRWITDDPPGAESPFPREERLGKKADSEEMQKVMKLGSALYEQILAERKSGKRALPVKDIPRFDYAPQPVRQALSRVSTSIVALFIINLFCATLAFLRFRRYDVRSSEA